MKRRNFLGACLAAIAAPLAALTQPVKPKDPRIFYATEKIKFGEKSKESPVVGKDSVGLTYNFDMDPEELIAKMKEATVKFRSIMVTYDKPNMNCDIYMSPEAFEDIKAWSCADVDAKRRQEIMENGWDMEYGAVFDGLCYPAIHITKELGREEIFELGRPGHYHRFVDYPVEITEEINAEPSKNDNS